MRKVDQAMDIVQIVPQCSYVLTNKGRDKPLEAFQFTVLALSLESAYLINRSHHLTDYMDRFVHAKICYEIIFSDHFRSSRHHF